MQLLHQLCRLHGDGNTGRVINGSGSQLPGVQEVPKRSRSAQGVRNLSGRPPRYRCLLLPRFGRLASGAFALFPERKYARSNLHLRWILLRRNISRPAASCMRQTIIGTAHRSDQRSNGTQRGRLFSAQTSVGHGFFIGFARITTRGLLPVECDIEQDNFSVTLSRPRRSRSTKLFATTTSAVTPCGGVG